jgi:hypothetical protein
MLPLDPAEGPVARFACELRELRATAGELPFWKMARRVRGMVSKSALAAAVDGRRLPSPKVLDAFVRACGGDVAWWQARLAQAQAQLSEAPGTALVPLGERGVVRLPAQARALLAPPRSSLLDNQIPAKRRRLGYAVAGVALTAAGLVLAGVLVMDSPSRDRGPAITVFSPTMAAPSTPAGAQADRPTGGILLGHGCLEPATKDIAVDLRPRAGAGGDGWFTDTGGWTGSGCDGVLHYSRLSGTEQVEDSYAWRTATPLDGPALCAVAVYIPDSPHTTASAAHYTIADTRGEAGQFTVDQAAHRGSWQSAPAIIVSDAREITLTLTDAGTGGGTVVASTAIVSCVWT